MNTLNSSSHPDSSCQVFCDLPKGICFLSTQIESLVEASSPDHAQPSRAERDKIIEDQDRLGKIGCAAWNLAGEILNHKIISSGD